MIPQTPTKSMSHEERKSQHYQHHRSKIFFARVLWLYNGRFWFARKGHFRLIHLVRQLFLQSFELRGAKRSCLRERKALVRQLLLALLLLSALMELLQAVLLTWELLFQTRWSYSLQYKTAWSQRDQELLPHRRQHICARQLFLDLSEFLQLSKMYLFLKKL